MLEIIQIYEGGKLERNRYVKVFEVERYDIEEGLRTITRIEITGKQAYKRVTKVGMRDGRYEDGRQVKIEYKEGKKFYNDCLKELPKAKEVYKGRDNANGLTTYYFKEIGK